MDNEDRTEVSRRRMLGLLAAGSATLAAAACTDTSDSGEDGDDNGGGPQDVNSEFTIPDPAVKLPTGQVKLSWMDSGDVKAFFFEDFVEAYNKKHSNITIDYNGSNWNNITQVLTTGLRSGSAPDVFQLPTQIPRHVAVANGWLGAFDDVMPDLAEIKQRFPVGLFADGITDFNGKTYGMPMTSNLRVGNLLLFNADYTEEADLDLSNEIITWDQLREYAKKLTDQGQGNYYGIIFGLAQPNALNGPASAMCEMSGVAGGVADPTGGINWKTGEFNHQDPMFEELIETFLAMRDDGSIHPDSVSLDQPGARQRMPQGQAALMFQGPWNIPIWKDENPDFNLGLNLPPQNDPNNFSPLAYGPGGSNGWSFSAKSKYAEVVGDIFSYWASEDGQVQWALRDTVADPAAIPAAVERALPTTDDLSKKAADLGTKYNVIAPEPSVRNPDVQQVYLELVPPTPNLSDRLMELYTKKSDKSVAQVLKEAKDAAEKSLEEAIAAAKKKGAKVSRDDWVFADWDPRKPYDKLYEK